MKEQLIELLNIIFQRDNQAINDIVEKFDYKEEDYTRPPENAEDIIDTLLQMDQPEINCEFSHGHIHTEDIKSNGLKLKEGAVELWFKFFDVRTRRKRIFRTGDYYLRLINNGFDKWHMLFYIKGPQIVDNQITEGYILAQHPHTSHGRPCFAAMETGIIAAITNYNFNGFLWRIRTFLNSWNYRSPHNYPDRHEQRRVKIFENERMFEQSDNGIYIFDESSYYLNTLSIPSDICNHETKDFMLTSARLKNYDAEPVSRLFYHIQCSIQYLNNDGVIPFYMRKPNLIYSIGYWLKNQIKEEINISQALIISMSMLSNFQKQIKSQAQTIEGEWLESYDSQTRFWYNFSDKYRHYRDNRDKKYPGSISGNYLWYLGKETDNPDSGKTCLELLDEIINFRNLAQNYRDKLEYDSGPTAREIETLVFNEVSSIMKDFNEEPFETASNFIEFINEYNIVVINNTININDEMDKFITRTIEIESILDKEYKKQLITYHKEELRRLEENGKQRRENTVQIENLNL